MWTTVPRSPAFRPCSGRSTVRTTGSSSLIIVRPSERVGGDQPGYVRPGFNEPDRPQPDRAADWRVNYTVDHVALPEGRTFFAGNLVVGRVTEQRIGEN